MIDVGVVGISHQSSDLNIRERLGHVFQDYFGKQGQKSIQGSYVLLTTCNRVELYFSSQHLVKTHHEILQILRKNVSALFEPYLYSYFGKDCFLHLARVISGVDSAIYGESEIQRQVKVAYEYARRKEELSSSMHYLFQKGLKIGKDIRSSILLPNQDSGLAQALFSIIQWIYKNERDLSVLFIGNSEINRRILSFFRHRFFQKMTLCTRMKSRLQEGCHLIQWDALSSWNQYEVIICGTHHHTHILNQRMLHQEPITSHKLIFDLSVPRVVDPCFEKHPLIYLFNIDQITGLSQRKKEKTSKEIELCEKIIEKASERQLFLFEKKRRSLFKYQKASKQILAL